MTVNKARKVLANNGVFWTNYMDLIFIKQSRSGNWVGCEEVGQAVDRMIHFISSGK